VVDRFVQDLRAAVRQITRAPGLALAVALTLALGLGANTAVFSLINGYTRPLPVPDPDRLVVMAAVVPADETGLDYRFSYPAIEDYRRDATTFEAVFAFDLRVAGLSVDGQNQPFVANRVTGNFFTGLGVTPAAGRLFAPEEGEGERAITEAVIVLGHGYWLRRFGGDPAVVGREVRLNGRAARVVGVAQPGFRGVREGVHIDGYVPLGVDLGSSQRARTRAFEANFTDRSVKWLTMMGRLQPGVDLSRAQAAADLIAADLSTRFPQTENSATRSRSRWSRASWSASCPRFGRRAFA
jgi:hypothetical protein